MNEPENGQGEIESPEARARLMAKWGSEAHSQLDALIQEARTLKSRKNADGESLDFARLMQQLKEADKLLGLKTRQLPRNYTLVYPPNSSSAPYLRKNGRKVTPETLAFDIASGWLYQLMALLDSLVQPMRPKQITAKLEE